MLVAFVIGAKSITDNSLLTHLATGDLILGDGAVPSVDPYSRTAPGLPWTVQSWLASLAYATVDRVGGGGALRLLHGLVAAMLGAGLWRLTAPARQVVPRTALTMMPIVIGAGLWSPRPFMFGLLAMVALLGIVQSDRSPALLLPLFWFWTNTHGSFPLGLALLGGLLVGQVLDDLLANNAAAFGYLERNRLLRYLGFGVGGTLLGALNPVGPRILWFPVQLLGRREALEGVVEWQAPSFTTSPEIVFLGLVPVVAIAARRGAPWRDLFPAVCFVLGGFLAIRNISIAAVVVVVLLAPSFRDMFGAEDGTSVNLISRTLGPAVCAAGILVAAIVVGQPGLNLDLYPVEEVDYLEARGLTGTADAGLIHREAVGNYLAYRYGPESSVFIDDRFDFYPTMVTKDHLVLLDGGDYGAVLDRWDGEVVLWEAETVLADWLAESDRWDVVVDHDDWIIACRMDSKSYNRCSGSHEVSDSSVGDKDVVDSASD